VSAPRHRSLLLALAVLSAPLAPAFADPLLPTTSPARHRIVYTSLTAGQWNPLGLQSDLTVGYRRRLFASSKLALADNFAGAMLIARLNPAYARLGGGLEVQPVTVLTVRFIYEHYLFFGSARMLQSFAGPLEPYDDDTMRRRADAGESYATHGAQLALQVVLRARVGPVAVLDDFSVAYHRMSLRGGDRVFYLNYFDTLTPNRGLLLTNHAHLVLLWRSLIVGARHTLVHAMYPEEWLEGNPNPNTPNHRLGPIVAWTFRDLGPRLGQPMLVGILSWWIGNRNRSGAGDGLYAVLAFQLSGDLWSR
jgi:hypothetical protein